MPMERTSIIVSGATSQIGFFLLPRLTQAGFHVHALSRTDPGSSNRAHPLVTWRQTEISDGWKGSKMQDSSQFIHLAPVWLLPDVIDELFSMGIRRIVAVSSTSRFTKMTSTNLQEQEIAKKLMAAEERVIEKCSQYMIPWTLLRTTLIYGAGMDENVTVIARFIRRFGFFPLVGEGKGCRQPVHADDIASACEKVMNDPTTFNRAYNLSGGQTITFREMVETIFLALNKKPRIVIIPLMLASPLMALAAYTRAYRHITREMMERVNQDLCFDSSDARRDFGYLPRGFHYRDVESSELAE